MIERLLILWHFVTTRWFAAWRNRDAALRRFFVRVRRESLFYREQKGDLPVMTKERFLAHFQDLNRHSISLEEATAVALWAERERDFKPMLPDGVSVGLSSGTSGERHVFLVGRSDRCRWAGQMLGHMLSRESLWQILNPFTRPLRIGFFLRASSNLYTTLSSLRVRLDYFDLTQPLEESVRRLRTTPPDVLVAPATVLAELARRVPDLRPRQVISVAEVLDARDRAEIEKTFHLRVAEVYQAAEGFLGCTCPSGRLHLNEETVHFEPEWLDENHDRFYPVITDFTRQTQHFIRYRLTDLLRLNPAPCPCGRRTRTLTGIEGRAEEVLWLKDEAGHLSPVFPDGLRQALYATPETLGTYRIEQHGDTWQIRLQKGDEKMVAAALESLVQGLRLTMPYLQFQHWSDQPPSEKQKRIRCIIRPE